MVSPVRLGTTDLVVGPVALGCMGFGEDLTGRNPWSLDEEAAGRIFRRAVELGVTLWDTANVYGAGSSEEVVGRAVRRYASRGSVVIATKVGLPMGPRDRAAGLRREAVRAQLEASLRRLGTDHIDLYQIHRHDPAVPAEEVVAALDEAVTSGKVRYIGASSMPAFRFAQLHHAAVTAGGVRFRTMQNQYSLVQREEEREMMPLLQEIGVVSLPWCPLAKGRLARPLGAPTPRSTRDPLGERFFGDVDAPIVGAVGAVALARGVSMAQVALSWVMSRPAVAVPVVGVTRPEQLADAVGAQQLELTADEVDALERHYTPRFPTGF